MKLNWRYEKRTVQQGHLSQGRVGASHAWYRSP